MGRNSKNSGENLAKVMAIPIPGSWLNQNTQEVSTLKMKVAKIGENAQFLFGGEPVEIGYLVRVI